MWLSLGSNVDAKENLQLAINHLDQILGCIRISPAYITTPWGGINQANFINMVVGGLCSCSARRLLLQCQEIEEKSGRVRTIKNGPRTLDIDILIFGEDQINTSELTVPHPGLYERDFALIPLLDLLPEGNEPINKKPLHSLKNKLKYFHIVSQSNHIFQIPHKGKPI